MKKIFMLLAACVAMVFVSCSKDDDATVNPDGKKLVSKISSKDADNELTYNETTFQYDKNGTIEKIVEKGREVDNSYDDEWTDTYVFTRSGNKITAKCDYTYTDNKKGKTETDSDITEYTLNDKGYISQYEWVDDEDDERSVYKYSYNDEGQLIERTEEEYRGTSFREYTYEYGWSNGNLISKRQSGSSYAENYTYTNEENKANIDFGVFYWEIGVDDYLELFGYLGKTNKNCLYKDGNSSSTIYKYTFDGDGYVTKIQEYYTNGSSNELRRTYTVEYK